MKDSTSVKNKYTAGDLKAMQAWDLDHKVQVSQTRLIEWYERWGGSCYVSFSGGKDSCVLAYLAAQVCQVLSYKLILWFSDTGLEFPEIKRHVKFYADYLREQFPDIEVELIYGRPQYGRADRATGKKKGDRITFRDVIKKYGYPLISKEVAQKIYEARKKPDGLSARRFLPNDKHNVQYGNKYSMEKWNWLKDSNIPISNLCCNVMKKNPSKFYEKQSGNKVITGTMATESSLRRTSWMQQGCNAFNGKRPQSKPLSFWTTQDVLEFIVEDNIPISEIYGDIVKDDSGRLFNTKRDRTGCMLCGFGCHLEKEPNRFQKLKQSHPGIWEWAMKPYDDGGLGYKEVLDYINVKYE